VWSPVEPVGSYTVRSVVRCYVTRTSSVEGKKVLAVSRVADDDIQGDETFN